MDQRVQFIADWLSGDYQKSELCQAYGISRPTGDKWIRRYQDVGLRGLEEQSRAPLRHPNATAEELCQMVIQTKLAHQRFGPKKVLDLLREQYPQLRWPADSTAGEILKRAGLVQERRRRRRVAPHSAPLSHCQAPNQVWSADFKGDFRLGNARRCYPLTITDNHTRYLFQCRGLAQPSYAAVQPWFEWVFREYGLPEAIRTDNGAPFASMGLGGIGQLTKWWIRLGIRPERIRPGKPAQNGRHERMHRTLKDAGVAPVRDSLAAQQRQFDAFVQEYNWERSHEALGRRTPGSLYRPSPRPFPSKLPPLEYPAEVVVRAVRHNGEIKWRGHKLYVSAVLAGEPISLKQLDEQSWEVRYSFHLLGVLNERNGRIEPCRGWHGSGKT